jgi:predicted transcriptional regulator
MTGKPIPIRLDDEIVKRLDDLAQKMSERTGGATITRVNALRAVLLQGLPILEEENGLSRARGKSKKR